MNKHKFETVAFLIMLTFLFIGKDVSAKAISKEEGKLETENLTIEGTITNTTITPDRKGRIEAIGELSMNYDPSLVIRKGRTVTIILGHNINAKMNSTSTFYSSVKKNIYDDSDQNLLIPSSIELRCAFRISEEHGKIVLNITAVEMKLWCSGSS